MDDTFNERDDCMQLYRNSFCLQSACVYVFASAALLMDVGPSDVH